MGRALLQHHIAILPLLHQRFQLYFWLLTLPALLAVLFKRLQAMTYLLQQLACRVPDDWLLKNKRPLLHGREVLREVLATWQARAKELPR